MKFKPFVFSAALIIAANVSFSQDNLVNSLKSNQSADSKEGFKFTDVINLANTTIKNQGSSGTCWSYSTNSFLESEMIRLGKDPIELSPIYSARCAYIEKAKNYVRMHGAVTLGDGGETHDVINMYRKYGALPLSVYTGLNYGTSKNKFGEMAAVTQAMLEAIVKNPNGQLTPNWLSAYTAVLDAYLGNVPQSFSYKGKNYTPQSFAKELVGINPDDYIELSSLTDYPYYKKFTLLIPDNWSFDQVYNVHMDEMTDIIDNALKNGYTVAWATDVSEKSFSWKNGVAYVPETSYEDMTDQQKAEMFNGPKPELAVTPEIRQQAFDNYNTTDDHGMHIVGISKDQNGKEYYIVKNSWGTTNDYKGYLYVTRNFVKYKTTSLLLHKKAIPSELRKKIGV
ncbi:bleomycin hydrolase [Arcticibacter tournemirensis]|uniref:Aminopeptidase n=1 Tax=Arcticibacter tournemirensis TaxID=699437 RepID=A0A5M9HBY4_9SPHI|nr:C1 family peptidase [Arcticibacter tournemirensis]KAA8484423.1 aminopeptidase [Arcticibacter tournemirensis]TQM49867.1 bleomycin hydrolase [Arcticibacter tournemirensis]